MPSIANLGRRSSAPKTKMTAAENIKRVANSSNRRSSTGNMTTTSSTTKKDYDSMSIKDLRALLTRNGVDCSAFLEKSELVAAAKKLGTNATYDEEAHKIFDQLNLHANGTVSRSPYSNLDAIWRFPSANGGKVYVGNYMAASTRQTLVDFNITAIVNCQGIESQNYFENDPQITYFRFPVANLSHSARIGVMGGFGGNQFARKGMQPVFDFLDEQTSRGNNVLVHCLAGAHRAGTVGVAYLMYKANLSVEDAIIAAKKCRPIINPFSTLLALLKSLEKDFKQQPPTPTTIKKGQKRSSTTTRATTTTTSSTTRKDHHENDNSSFEEINV